MFLPIVCEDISACNYGDTLPFLPPENPWFGGGSGYLIYDSNCNIISEEPCLFGEDCGVLGCTDPLACNYNIEANQDDNSCEYESCVCDTVFITEYVTDTIIEYVQVILTEYLDCETGLPCDSVVGLPEIINQSSTNGKIYNLLGQEIIQKDGLYIEGGEVKYGIRIK